MTTIRDILARSEQMAAMVREKISERPHTDKAERMLILEMHDQLERCEALLSDALRLMEPRMADSSGVKYPGDWVEEAVDWRDRIHKTLGSKDG